MHFPNAGVYNDTEYDIGETIVTNDPCRRW